MNVPNFLCIGAQKSGTTLLYELLKEIDDICLPTTKEIHFFDQEKNYIKGLSWYKENYFDNSYKYSAVGEITPSYIFIDEAPKRIYESLGSEVKFIVILRNPIERAYSQYIMKYKSEEEVHSFNDALILESKRTKSNLEYNKKFSYLKRGLYFDQINNYLKYFNKKQFLFIEFSEFVNHQDETIESICDFLNVKKDKKISPKVIHTSKLSIMEKLRFSIKNNNYNIFNIFTSDGYPSMPDSIRTTLKEYYKDDVLSLEKIINKDLSKWLQ